MLMGSWIVTLALFLVAVIIIAKAIRVVPQQHALVIERWGRFHTVLAPGLNFVVPFVEGACRRRDHETERVARRARGRRDDAERRAVGGFIV